MSFNMRNIRTDMASELRQRHAGEIPGVCFETDILFGQQVFHVDIFNTVGEQTIGKPQGEYYTLSLPQWFDRGSEHFAEAVRALSELIVRCLPEEHERVLVAALGNPDITPDALGSLAAASILVTRHLKEQKQESFPQFCSLAMCRPGVLGTSGIETAAQVKTICDFIKPQLVVVIDALAGAEAESLCRSIQVSNTGISPGSGVGNDREEISAATLGIPVMTIGVPTVIDAGFLGEESLRGMFVTPRNIDSLVRHAAKLIAYALNLTMHHGLDLTDIDALVG